MKPKLLFLFVSNFIFLSVCYSQTSSYKSVKNVRFISAETGGGAAFGLGPISKNSPKANELGKLQWGFLNYYRIEAILKGKYGVGIGFDFNYNELINDSIAPRIKAWRPDTNNTYSLDNSVSLVIIRYYLGVSWYYDLTERVIIQPKLDLCVGAYDYDYSALVSDGQFSNPSYYYYQGSEGFFLSVNPELNVKYLLLRKTWFEMALCFSARYQNAKMSVVITESGDSFFSTRPPENKEVTRLKGRAGIVYPSIGLAWMFKYKKRRVQ
jgi:hypothetical protein